MCVGLLTAVAAAILSGEDAISPLTGAELFDKKVCKIICMGYTDTERPNFNWDMDKMAAKAFFEHCPVSVYASPTGGNIITGVSLSNRLQIEHPLRQIYEIYNGPNGGRASWDLIAALYAVEPESTLFTIKEKGMCRYDGSKSYWESNGNRCDYELTLNASVKEMEEIIIMLKDFTEDKYDIFIQAGQSNSEGYGVGNVDEPYQPNETVWYLNNDLTISRAAEWGEKLYV